MSQDDDKHIYNSMDDGKVTYQCRPEPKEMHAINSEQVAKATSTRNDKDLTKINTKLKVVFSIVAVQFILMLALFGVLFAWAFRSDIQDNELKELLIKEVLARERSLGSSIADLENASRNATRTLERNFVRGVEGATSSLNQSGHELMNIVKDNKREIDMLRKDLNKRIVTDCSKVDPSNYKSGNQSRGVFEIYISGQPIDVFCDLSADSGNWTVFQRRMDGSVDFFRNHAEYVVGFGSVVREYWIGLQNLYNILQSSENFELRIDMEDWDGLRKFAKYSRFDIGAPQNDYVLSVSGYSGTAGDSLVRHNGFKFSTKDHDVDSHPANCADGYKGAWWYANCHDSNLNGLYHKGGPHESYGDGINWKAWRDHQYSLKFVEMKIKPIN